MEDVMMYIAYYVCVASIIAVYVAILGIPVYFFYCLFRCIYNAFRGIDETKTKTKNTDCHNCQSYHSYYKTWRYRP